MPEVCLQYVSPAGFEACGTIGEVISPHPAETLVESELRHLVGHPVEATEPGFQHSRVVETETVEFGDLQSGLAALVAQARGRQQHAAGEDIGLYEVRMTAVAFEELVGDHDRLDDRRTAGRGMTLERREVVGPVALADRLDHLDRDDVVVAPLDVAIITELQIDAVRQPGPLQPGLGVVELLARDGDAGHPHAAPRRGLGEAAPAAADLQDAVALASAELVEDAVVL